MNGNEATLAMIAAIEDAGVAYMLVGSLSTNSYGIVRATKDADIVVQFGSTSIHEIVDRIPAKICLDPQIAFESVTGTTRYIFHVEDEAFHIELFRLSDDPHDQTRFQRRKRSHSTPLGREVVLPTAEDVIITKLRWALHAARAKDRDDVRDVIIVQDNALDWPYIHAWCERHGTRALLDEIRASIPPID